MPIDNHLTPEQIEKNISAMDMDDPTLTQPIEEEPEATPPDPVVPPVTPEPPEPVTPPADPDDKTTPTTPTPPTSETKSTTDYQTKFVESSREASVLASKNKKLVETIEQAAEIVDITEDDLKKEYTDWDIMSDTERRLAKDNAVLQKRFGMILESSQEGKEIDKWSKKVDVFIDDNKNNPLYKEIDGREEEFKVFCNKPTRRGVDLEDLVRSFVYDPNPSQKHTGSLLATGSGGTKPNNTPTDQISDEDQAALLRTKDPKKWQEMVRTGKIVIDI